MSPNDQSSNVSKSQRSVDKKKKKGLKFGKGTKIKVGNQKGTITKDDYQRRHSKYSQELQKHNSEVNIAENGPSVIPEVRESVEESKS